MHFYRRDLRLPDNLELLKAAGSIIPEITYLSPSSRTLRLKIDVVKFIFTFWMGFDSIEEVAASL
ncbi:Uncharacterized protein FKW44_024494 [Caligus rogercresseyi]|uniref:Uncharacterized protein n=1 Tax=Caligus rogercresseyi TaxID=217165 RepID=A0A7T8JUD4_CALRO|nr:Uncharacterized protein FKW44_024494 [Caligus rogercresseyi]